MRRHIHSCADCHARVIAREPLQIFALLADEERGEEFWIGFWPAIRSEIRAADAESAAWRRWFRRPAFAWGAAAAAILLLAALAIVIPWGGAPPGEGAGSRSVPVAADDPWRELLPAAVQQAGTLAPTIEEVRSPTAHVLSLKVYGRDEGVAEVVMIVDEEIQL